MSAFDSFISYDIKTHRGAIRYITPLLRYDYMSDHSDGMRYTDESDADGSPGRLIINDYRRSRLTGGITLSLRKPFVSDIRLNFEKYFYRHGAIAHTSEKDKLVIEIMTRF